MQNKQLVLNNFIINLKKIIQKEQRNLVFVCIGNSRIVGDSFGPLVGSYLKILMNKEKEKIKILGDIEEPIYTEKNIKNVAKLDNEQNCMIVIDSALSKENINDTVFISKNKTFLGNGVGKTIYAMGDISIKGVVAQDRKDYKKNLQILQDIDIKDVIDMAKIVSYGIAKILKN